MTYMRSHRKQYSAFIETLSRRRSANTPAVLAASMFSDFDFSSARTVWKELSNSFGKLLHVSAIQFCASLSLPVSPPFSSFRIREAFSFGLSECVLLNQETLTFVSPASLAKF